jgi:hypothetical protein
LQHLIGWETPQCTKPPVLLADGERKKKNGRPKEDEH